MIARLTANPIQYFRAGAAAMTYNTAAASGFGNGAPSGANLSQGIPSSTSSSKNNTINSGPQKTGDKECKT